MKLSTETSIRKTYAALEDEARIVFGITRLPVLNIYNVKETTLAFTDFVTEVGSISCRAQQIGVNAHTLGLVYEDEMQMILRHEIAHVMAGLDAQHDGFWKDTAIEFSTLPTETMFVRKSREFYRRVGKPHLWKYVAEGFMPTMDLPEAMMWWR